MSRVLGTVGILLALTFASQARPEGISSQRAHDLATTYMMQYISLCGVVEAPISRATFWELPIRIGQAAQPAGAIHVDKRTGSVSYPHHHPTATPRSLAAWEKSLEKRHK
jgi:hypothetical protein